MSRRSVFTIAVLAVLGVIAMLVHRSVSADEPVSYRFTTVERGDIESTVSATGTLGAVTTVQVGTQASGQISELLVDFNDEVKKGQLLARIDPALQQQAVADAQAAVERARAQYVQAQRDFGRSGELLNAGLVARSEYETTDSSLDVARANLKSAQIALDRARRNLEYTSIYAPIDGVVVERNVDHGQTVAASLSAPQLFLIANDLTNMQILASVGEGDIASIKEGQKVRFTVQALAGQTFEGTVQQVRLQSKTSENVVNYTVAVAVANPEKKLLPGMTARVDFLTASADDVLKVANSALRFKPAVEVEKKAAPGRTAQAGDATGQRRRRPAGAQSANGGTGTLHYLDANGQLQVARVRTGLTDGSSTEIRTRDLKEGAKVIAGVAAPQAAESSASSPFQSGGSGNQRGSRPPGGF